MIFPVDFAASSLPGQVNFLSSQKKFLLLSLPSVHLQKAKTEMIELGLIKFFETLFASVSEFLASNFTFRSPLLMGDHRQNRCLSFVLTTGIRADPMPPNPLVGECG